jgi:metal-sulfur cluster biosynthetic enzyme
VTTCSKEDVISRLYEIIDPCSAATNVPLSIVEMGMVENVELASGNVIVALRMTSPMC